MGRENKINVLFVLNSFGTGGSERIVFDLCKGLDRNTCVPFVVGLYGGELIDEFGKIGVWSACLNKKRGLDFDLMYRLSRIIKEKKIDVINAHHFSPFIHACPSSLMNGKPLIYTDHTVQEIQQIPFYWRIIGTVSLRLCYGVVGISKGCTKQLMDSFYVPAQKAFTILNAIDLGRFEHRIDRQEKKKALGLGDNETVIGCIGNLREQKNHDNLLRAFQIIRERMDNVKLVIVGDGPMRDHLYTLSNKLGISPWVIFTGARLDAVELYQIMDVYCLSSHYEGLPLTILEAMASDLPVVGTDVIGINDVIVNGENGLLAEPNNPGKLAETILDVLAKKELARSLVENGHRYVYAHHHIVPWLKEWEALFVNAAMRSCSDQAA